MQSVGYADPLVSIVMPAFNAGATIADSIRSVLSQTHSNWELLIVDDGSTDDTGVVVGTFLSDRRIRLLKGAGRGGPARARNVGLDAATGDMVAFLDSDDQWIAHKTEAQLAFMKRTGAVLSYTAYWRVDIDGRTRRGQVEVPSSVTYESLLETNSIGCLTAMYDRRLFPDARMPDVGRLAEGTWLHQWLNGRIGHEDYAFWLALLRSSHAHGRENFASGINEPMALYRLSANSLSSNKLRAAAFQWLVYRRVEKLSIPNAAVSFCRYARHGLKKHRLLVSTEK
jgi:teichuronic acid biosynthesis glycosyltransferase TuaG